MSQTFLSQFDIVERISHGMSGDAKYRVSKDGSEFLLRVAKGDQYPIKQREYRHLERLNRAGLPVPACITLEKDAAADEVYTLLSWVPGEEAEKILPQTSPEEQYRYGIQAGEILRQIHNLCPVDDSAGNWYDRYFAVIEPRLAAYRREGEAFDGCETILRFIKENRHLLKTRPLCRHHSDYHMGNLIINDGQLWVIDWHTVDFDNIGDPWYEFNRLGIEHPAFARGQIDGYFNHQVPEEFWRLFALYFAASAITSIVWAKHWAPEQFDNIMRLNCNVLHMFENMENPVPRWYRPMTEGGCP